MEILFGIYKNNSMEKIKIFIQLTRLNKPIGYMLLFWPCLWGLTLASDLEKKFLSYLYFCILFFLGSVLMRSAGCIVNDIVDKNFDKKVFRTQSRPIPSGKILVSESMIYTTILCILAFIILIQFNYLTICLGMFSMFFAFSYPYMKRITYWPQLFLGLTFNWGIIMAWTSVTNSFDIKPFILYGSAIFWTLGYDTIYGLQDIKDDEIIGVKSTSIKFKKKIKMFVSICYMICFLLLLTLGIKMNFNFLFILTMLAIAIQFFYQIKIFEDKIPQSCLRAFKSNNYMGFLIFLNILTLNFSKL